MLAHVQRLLSEALQADDPAAALERRTAEADGLPAEDRLWLEQLDRDGLRLAGLLIRKVRFELLMRGDADNARWFREDPVGFSELFQAYLRAAQPRSYFPAEEAERFRRWRDAVQPDARRGI